MNTSKLTRQQPPIINHEKKNTPTLNKRKNKTTKTKLRRNLNNNNNFYAFKEIKKHHVWY